MHVELEGITFVGLNTYSRGIIVETDGSLTLRNCHFIGPNNAQYLFDIRNQESLATTQPNANLTLEDCTFDGFVGGGVIRMWGEGSLIMRRTLFTNLLGPMSITDFSSAVTTPLVVVDRCTFVGNWLGSIGQDTPKVNAPFTGKAMLYIDNFQTVLITLSTFMDNQCGAAVLFQGARLGSQATVVSSTFTDIV